MSHVAISSQTADQAVIETSNSVEELTDRQKLDKFLSAVRTTPDTATLYVKSIDSEITIQELDTNQISRIIEMEETKNNYERALEMVAMAIIYPNLNDPNVRDLFYKRIGQEALPVVEIVKRIFKAGEIPMIADKVAILSGLSGDEVITQLS